MYLIRWFNRKYPKSKKKIWGEFYHKDNEYIEMLKNQNYRVGVLTDEFETGGETYPKGTMLIYKRVKDESEGQWSGDFDYVGLFKCIKSYLTESGFHSFRTSHIKLTELTK